MSARVWKSCSVGGVSEILIKKRLLSLDMIRRFHRKQHIPLERLIGTAA